MYVCEYACMYVCMCICTHISHLGNSMVLFGGDRLHLPVPVSGRAMLDRSQSKTKKGAPLRAALHTHTHTHTRTHTRTHTHTHTHAHTHIYAE